MVWLNNITIKTRLILGFGLVVLLLVIFGVYSLAEMDRLGKLTTTLYEHPLKVSNAALAASMGVVKMHRDMKEITLSTAELDLHAAIQAVNSEEDKVYRNLDVIRTQILGDEGQELERETRDLFAEWKPIRNEVIQLVMEGNNKAASLTTKGKVADHVAHLERRIMELRAYAREKADGFISSANDVQNKVWWYTIIWIGVVGVVCTTAAMGHHPEHHVQCEVIDNNDVSHPINRQYRQSAAYGSERDHGNGEAFQCAYRPAGRPAMVERQPE